MGRAGWVRFAVAALAAFVLGLAGLVLAFAVNVASGLSRWPGPADWVRRHALWSIVLSEAVAAGFAGVALWQRTRKDSGELPGYNLRAAPETVTTLGPSLLEVHTAVGSGASVTGLTAYLPRAHDGELRAELGSALAGGPSRLIILTGESSTGKTRALYEALVELWPHAPLLHPVGKQALVELLNSGRVTSGCVLWLNEAQRFLYGDDGEQAAIALRAVLQSTAGIAVVGTLWTDPYWNELTAAGRGDPHAQARALLTHPQYSVRLDVPDHLGAQDLGAWRNLAVTSGDRRLMEALAAGRSGGRVIQHLSGGPELLEAYLVGPGRLFTPREHALLTAAIDARRFGHITSLPTALLAAAADGDLPGYQRAQDQDWAQDDLSALATGRRTDDSRTDIRDTLTALIAVRAQAGAEPGYEPADYLDQHIRSLRADQPGSIALWQALSGYTTDPGDQDRLARAAWNRGLRTIAVRMWHKAVTAGHPTTGLAELGTQLDPTHEAGIYSAAHADLTNPGMVGRLLTALRKAGAEKAVAILLDRNPASHVDPTNPDAVCFLLRVLQEIEAEQAVTVLAERAATRADLTSSSATIRLLRVLRTIGAEQAMGMLAERVAVLVDLTDSDTVSVRTRLFQEIGAKQAVVTLAGRAATHAGPIGPDVVAMLLRAVRGAKTTQAVAALIGRAATDLDLTDPRKAAELVSALHGAGAKQAAADLAGRAATEVNLTLPGAVAELLRQIRWAGQAVEMLLERDPAAHVDPADPREVHSLLEALRDVGDERAMAKLAGRAAACAPLTDPLRVSWLLGTLREHEADQAVATLLERNPAAQVDLTDPDAVAILLRELWQAEAEQAVATLLERNPIAHAKLTNPDMVNRLLRVLPRAEAEQALATLIGRADFNNPDAVARLLKVLQQAEAGQAVAELAGRAATHAALTDPDTVAKLLRVFQEVGAKEAVAALLQRDPGASANLAAPGAVARLLEELRKAGAEPAVATLLKRDPATYADLTNLREISQLLKELRDVGDEQGVATLAERAAATADLSRLDLSIRFLEVLREVGAEQASAVFAARQENAGHYPEHFAPHGREPDNQRTAPWAWHDLVDFECR